MRTHEEICIFFVFFTSIFQAELNRRIDNYNDIYISQTQAFRVRGIGPIISVFVLTKFSFCTYKEEEWLLSDDPGFDVNINNYEMLLRTSRVKAIDSNILLLANYDLV